MKHPPPLGLLLLTGGQGRRLGGPKHSRRHSEGGSWGGHLVQVFETVVPKGPIQILGEPLPDRADLYSVPDEGLGGAAALIQWAGRPAARARRWWVLACDQVRWTPEHLRTWLEMAEHHDPSASRWVVARSEGLLQPLGGFLSEGLREPMALLHHHRLTDLVRALPHLVLEWDSPVWADVDTPGDLARWEGDLAK